MSVSSKVATEKGALAYANFRVRCETLGHGEAVYLVEEGDAKMQKVGSPFCVTFLVVPFSTFSP